eukprot:765074-Hanusia_phi.AAC.4
MRTQGWCWAVTGRPPKKALWPRDSGADGASNTPGSYRAVGTAQPARRQRRDHGTPGFVYGTVCILVRSSSDPGLATLNSPAGAPVAAGPAVPGDRHAVLSSFQVSLTRVKPRAASGAVPDAR